MAACDVVSGSPPFSNSWVAILHEGMAGGYGCNGVQIETQPLPEMKAGSVYSVLLDSDNGILRFWQNGVELPAISQLNKLPRGVKYFPVISGMSQAGSIDTQWTIRTLSPEFSYRPPSGFSAWGEAEKTSGAYLVAGTGAATWRAMDHKQVPAVCPDDLNCIIDPDFIVGGQTITNDGLTIYGGNDTAGNGNGMARATIGRSSGKWYFEAEAKRQYGSTDAPIVGLADSTVPASVFVGAVAANTYAYHANGGIRRSNQYLINPSYPQTDLRYICLGVAVDLDAGTLEFYGNGVIQAPPMSDLKTFFAAGNIYPVCSVKGDDPDYGVTFTFGARSMKYGPPKGYRAWASGGDEFVDKVLIAKNGIHFWGNVEDVYNQKWVDRFVLDKPQAGFVSPVLPLSNSGVLSAIGLYPKGAPTETTSVNLMCGTGNGLAAALTETDTAATLANAITLSQPTNMLVGDEVVLISAIGGTALSGTAITGTALTITRAQGGTVAAAHASGGSVMLQIATASISGESPVFVDGLSVAGATRDRFAWHVAGAGLAGSVLTVTAEWSTKKTTVSGLL